MGTRQHIHLRVVSVESGPCSRRRWKKFYWHTCGRLWIIWPHSAMLQTQKRSVICLFTGSLESWLAAVLTCSKIETFHPCALFFVINKIWLHVVLITQCFLLFKLHKACCFNPTIRNATRAKINHYNTKHSVQSDTMNQSKNLRDTAAAFVPNHKNIYIARSISWIFKQK